MAGVSQLIFEAFGLQYKLILSNVETDAGAVITELTKTLITKENINKNSPLLPTILFLPFFILRFSFF